MSNREEFENTPEVYKKLKDLHPTIVWFSDQENEYASSFDGFQNMVIWLNGAWYAWQAAKAQAVPEGFVLISKKPDVAKARDIALKRIVPPPKTKDTIQQELLHKKYVDDLYSEQARILLDYKDMIEAQESDSD